MVILAAIASVILFVLALIIKLVGGHANLVTDFELAGLICVGLTLLGFAIGWAGWPTRRAP